MVSESFFDTLVVKVDDAKKVHEKANANVEFKAYFYNLVGISLDETTLKMISKLIIDIPSI